MNFAISIKYKDKKSKQQLPLQDTDASEETEKPQKPVTKPIAKRREHRSCGSCPAQSLRDKKPIKYVDSDSTEVESSTDDEDRWKDVERTDDPPASYFHIQKLIKFIRVANPAGTVVLVCLMLDFDLKAHINQYAIQDVNGVELFVNTVECNNSRSRLAALMILAEISTNIEIRKTIVDLGGVPSIVEILNSSQRPLKTMAAETLAILSKVRLARKYIRTSRGIPKLLDLLNIKLEQLTTPREELSSDDFVSIEMASAGARALCRFAVSRHNKELMRKSGIVPLMARLLKSVHMEVIIPIMGTIQKCAGEPKFQLAIATEGMIADIVWHIKTNNSELQTHGSTTLFKVCIDELTRSSVRKANGLAPLVAIIKDESERENKPLLAGATGALWMCAVSNENVKLLDELDTVTALVNLLDDYDDDVLTNTAGAIAECVRFQNNREILRLAGGIPLLVGHLNSTHSPLLINLAKACGECAEDSESMIILEDLDALRLIWSLLRSTNTNVQATAGYAICPLVKNARDPGGTVYSLVFAMEVCVNLLKSDDINVLAAICAVIAIIALDRYNLAILTDLHVIYRLACLVNTTDDRLRETLADAIASCCVFGDNTRELGRLHTIRPIVAFMTSDNPRVHYTTVMALQKLSSDPHNCIVMHQAGLVPFLMDCVSSENKVLQLNAADCLRNIRLLGLHVEEHLLKIDEDEIEAIDDSPFFPKRYK